MNIEKSKICIILHIHNFEPIFVPASFHLAQSAQVISLHEQFHCNYTDETWQGCDDT